MLALVLNLGALALAISAIAALVYACWRLLWTWVIDPVMTHFNRVERIEKLIGANGHETVFETLHAHGEQLARVTTLADVMSVPIFETDRFGRVTFVNRSWERLTGSRLSDVQNMNWVEVIDRNDRAAYISDYLQALEQQRIFDHDVMIEGHDGRRLRVNVRAKPMMSGAAFLGFRGVLERIDDE